jgi:hypothetical protein
MERYRNLRRDSGVTDYELGRDFIRVRFRGGVTYRYGHVRPGRHHVDRMKALAVAGEGLGTYISQHVRDQYVTQGLKCSARVGSDRSGGLG